jgi:hypothetical protein
MPLYAFVFMLFTMANVGLPGTSGFVGEFMSLIGTFKANIQVAFIATLGVILSAAYALWLYRKVVFGTLGPTVTAIRDMGWREVAIFAPLVVLTILLGVAPKPVLDVSAASVAQLLDNYNHAIAGTKTAVQPSSSPGARGAGEPGIRTDGTRSVALGSGSGAEPVIGPAQAGRTRWRRPGMTGEKVAEAARAGIAAR